LQKELESYQAKKPWREAAPPELTVEPESPVVSENGAAAAGDVTAGGKRRR
jgi:hypothetical protein